MPYTHAYEKLHQSLVDLQGLSFRRVRGNILEGCDSRFVKILSSPLSHQLSITSQLGVREYDPLSIPYQNVHWLDLVHFLQRSTSATVSSESSGSFRPRRQCFALFFPRLWLLQFFLSPFLRLSLSLRWKAGNQTWVTCEK